MSTARPPDSPLSPMSRDMSSEEFQGTDRVTTQGMDLTDLSQNLSKVLGIGVSKGDGFQGKLSTDLATKEKEEQSAPVEFPINNLVNLGGSKGSWVGAVQGQKILKKYDMEIEIKDGIGSVTVPEEITKEAPLWDDGMIF